ncbi:MAG: hypothetical protein PHV20_03005 [Bacteroidales bacterium]|nr:hypothetical protein [Bacteroidales bacterium]
MTNEEDITNNNEAYFSDSAEATPSKFLYTLLRIYFIFMPANLLIVKIFGFRAITYWKDLAYILCFFLGAKYLVRIKPILVYISLISFTFLLQIIHGEWYFEYFTWLIMGLPMVLYLRFIKIKDYDKDIITIACLMVLCAIWILFFESTGGYENTFAIEEEGFTLLRDDVIRMRYYFVSPMALSQYTWFVMLLVFTNKRLTKPLKTIFLLSTVYTLVACNTRAGILLVAVSGVYFVYTYFFKLKKGLNFTIIIVFIIVIIIQVIKSALYSDGNASESDIERLLLLTLGIQGAIENFFIGLGGESFSPRSDNWLCFENSSLALINSFGIIGFILVGWFLYHFIFKTMDKRILLFSSAWIVYATIFPVLQETTPILITWFIISLCILPDRALELFSSDAVLEESEPDIESSHILSDISELKS